MPDKQLLIYGSYGFSGNLIAEHAIQQGLKPILAGRNENKLAEQAKRLNCEHRVFDVNDIDAVKSNLNDITTVIHCAGPFYLTYQNMVEACLATNTHYLDITGEFNVFEAIKNLDQKAKDANVMLLPGTGFDVVPSDCLASYLKTQLPDATELALAIHSKSNTKSPGVSRGTARTAASGLAKGGMIRDAGKLRRVPFAWKKRLFQFNNKPINCMTISWGDISTAWHSTGIPHIETYMSVKSHLYWLYKLLNPVKAIFSLPPVKQYLENKIKNMPEGPNPDALKHGQAFVTGEVKNAAGKTHTATLSMPNGYTLTALSAVHIAKKTLEGNAPNGYQTPATAYGMDLILEIPNTKRVNLTQTT